MFQGDQCPYLLGAPGLLDMGHFGCGGSQSNPELKTPAGLQKSALSYLPLVAALCGLTQILSGTDLVAFMFPFSFSASKSYAFCLFL